MFKFFCISITCPSNSKFSWFLAIQIKLYDHRLTQRGPVQSYEGNVNSHTRIEIGIDPSEKVVMSGEHDQDSHKCLYDDSTDTDNLQLSGGEDFYIRLWNIKSGELLFKDRFMNSIPSAVCWPRVGGISCFCQIYAYWFPELFPCHHSKVIVGNSYIGLLELTKDGQDHRCYWQDHSFGAWLGSYEGVFYMDWLW